MARFERHKGICVSLSYSSFQVLYVYHLFLNLFSINDEQLKPFLPLSLTLTLSSFAVIFLHSGTQFNLEEKKKAEPNLSTRMLNGPFYFLLGLMEQLWGEDLNIFGIWPRHLYLYGILMKSDYYKS